MTADWQLVVTTADPGRSAAFWSRALGYVAQPPPAGHRTWDAYARAAGIDLAHGRDIDAAVDPSGRRPRLMFVRDDPAIRGPLSVELLSPPEARTAAHLAARARDLVDHGAVWSRTVADGGHAWIELRDPDRHPFRIL